MFQHDYGFGPAPWMKWLGVGLVVYVVLSFVVPDGNPKVQEWINDGVGIGAALLVAAFWKVVVRWFRG
jgi:hypothetical protein